MDRKLASIQNVEHLEPIIGADKIELATVLGWRTVVPKGCFKPGDRCVYFEVDAVLPDGPVWSEFMRPRKFRVKTLRLRGQLSQGLALPLTEVLPETAGDEPHTHLGNDLTEQLGVTKHEAYTPSHPDAAGNFPRYLRKTEEVRLQSAPRVLAELVGRSLYMTQKLDGTSCTIVNPPPELDDGGVFACSRNMKLKRIPAVGSFSNDWYNGIIDFHDLDHKLPVGYAIQGEIVGPGIQGNPLQLTRHQMFVFSVYDIVRGAYVDYALAVDFVTRIGMEFVPVLAEFYADGWATHENDNTLGFWLEAADGYYGSGERQEGIVVRPMVETHSLALDGRLSFKVISNAFLLAEK